MRHNRTLKRKNRTQLYHHNRHASRQKKLGKKHSYLDLKTETDTTSALAMVNTTQKQNPQTLSSLASRKPYFVSLIFFTPAVPPLILPGHRHGSSLPTQLIPQICSNTDDKCARQLPKSWLLFSSPPESLTLSLPLFLPCSHLGAEPGQNLFPASFYPSDFYLARRNHLAVNFTRTLWSNPSLYSVKFKNYIIKYISYFPQNIETLYLLFKICNIPPVSPLKNFPISCSQMVPIVHNYLFLS